MPNHNIWILDTSNLRETTGEDKMSYSYRFIAGPLKGCDGAINKNFLSYACQLGDLKIITNPLEAYAWEYEFTQKEQYDKNRRQDTTTDSFYVSP